jgi:hypothetical protein
MAWYAYLAHFAGGLLMINAVPHFIEGTCGRTFPTPFAKPPGKGHSSPMVNVLWGLGNFLVAFILLHGVGQFDPGLNIGTLTVFAGNVVMAVLLAKHFGSIGQTG